MTSYTYGITIDYYQPTMPAIPQDPEILLEDPDMDVFDAFTKSDPKLSQYKEQLENEKKKSDADRSMTKPLEAPLEGRRFDGHGITSIVPIMAIYKDHCGESSVELDSSHKEHRHNRVVKDVQTIIPQQIHYYTDLFSSKHFRFPDEVPYTDPRWGDLMKLAVTVDAMNLIRKDALKYLDQLDDGEIYKRFVHDCLLPLAELGWQYALIVIGKEEAEKFLAQRPVLDDEQKGMIQKALYQGQHNRLRKYSIRAKQNATA